MRQASSTIQTSQISFAVPKKVPVTRMEPFKSPTLVGLFEPDLPDGVDCHWQDFIYHDVDVFCERVELTKEPTARDNLQLCLQGASLWTYRLLVKTRYAKTTALGIINGFGRLQDLFRQPSLTPN